MNDPAPTGDTAAAEPGMFVAPFRQLVHGIHQFGDHWSWRCGVLGALPSEEREAAGCRYDQVTDSWEALIEEASYHLRRYHGIHPEPDPGPACEHPPFVGGSCLACAERYYAAKLAEVRAAVSSSAPDDTAPAPLTAKLVIDAITAHEENQHDALEPDGWRPGHDYLRGYRTALEEVIEVVTDLGRAAASAAAPGAEQASASMITGDER